MAESEFQSIATHKTCAFAPLFGHPGNNEICPPSHPIIGENKLDRFERYIIEHESKFNPFAHNPKSSAKGIGQLLQQTRNAIGAKLGINPETTNYDEQLAMFKYYIAHGSAHFNTSEGAYNWWITHHWY